MIARTRLLCSTLAVVLLSGASAHAERGEHEEYRDPKVMELRTFQNVLEYPAKLTLVGQVQSGYRFSEAMLVRPDGSAVVIQDVDSNGETSEFRVPLELNRGKGIYRVELTARTGQDRTHTGVRALLFAGVPADHPDDAAPEDVTPDTRIPGEVLAAELFDRINAHRRRLRLDAVEWFEPLALVARAHAEDCVKLGKLDHRVNAAGTVVTRMEAAYGWDKDKLVYLRPRHPPTRDPDAKSYFPTILEGRRGIETVLHRWQRFAAFCVPMTSDLATHGACGIARTAKGTCFIVFSFAQVNGVAIAKDARRMFDDARRDLKSASDGDRPARLRALGLWRERAGLAEAKKFLRSPDPVLRGAALDVLLLDDPDGVSKSVEKELDDARLAYERSIDAPGRPAARLLESVEGARQITYVPRLADLATEVEALRHAAAQRAHERAAAIVDDPDGKRRALEAVVRDWPGTPASDAAASELDP